MRHGGSGHSEPPDREAARARLEPFLEKAQRFSGWDFPEIATRELDPPPPWDYARIVRDLAGSSRAALDLGTGGGEVLATLRPALPRRIVATEPWVVNAPVAFHRLSPLGVDVVRADSLGLPFRDASFDLILDRHEEFRPAEVDRVLTLGGRFVTQQVGRSNWRELRRYIPRMTDLGDLRSRYVREFRGLGLVVDSLEHEFRVAYPSLGDFVFLLCVAPWEIPDFSVDRDLDALLAFEADCTMADGLVVTESRYLIVARKSG